MEYKKNKEMSREQILIDLEEEITFIISKGIINKKFTNSDDKFLIHLQDFRALLIRLLYRRDDKKVFKDYTKGINKLYKRELRSTIRE